MDNLYVWRSGEIAHGQELPAGAILLMQSDNQEEFDNILVACRLMHDGSHVVGTVFDAFRAENAKTDEERVMATITCRHPQDTPEQALERWMEWRKLPNISKQSNCECIWCNQITGYENGCEVIECEWCQECFNECDVEDDVHGPIKSDG